jgi:hypothetical protein
MAKLELWGEGCPYSIQEGGISPMRKVEETANLKDKSEA